VTGPPPEREGDRPAEGPQTPAAPQQPAPAAPQQPAPAAPQQPAPIAPQQPAPGGTPTYAGPVPPGGWHEPLPPPATLPPGTELACWGSRFGARVLDALVLIVILLLVAAPGGVLLGLESSGTLGIVLLIVGILIDLAIWALYRPFLVRRHGRRNGQTLGKQWLGIRAIRNNGAPFDWRAGLLRELVVKGLLFNFIGFWFFATLPWLLNYLWPLWDDENRALHDMIVSTHVVKS
jgi:uncharacterized RDD family membrane protein YckC